MTSRYSELRRNIDLLGIAAVVMVFLAIATVTYTVIAGSHVGWNNSCGDDGFMYCRMALGQVVTIPQNRRILLPTMLRALSPSPTTVQFDFLVANVAGLAVASVGCAWLTLRLAGLEGVQRARRWAAAVLASTVFFVMPMGFGWIHYYPTLVDGFAVGLGTVWFALTVLRAPAWSAVAVACLTIMAREAWAPIIVIVMVAQYLADRTRARYRATVFGLLAVLLVTIAVMLGPSAVLAPYAPPVRPGLRNTVEQVTRFFSAAGVAQTAWMVLFALGLIPLLLVLARTARDTHLEDPTGLRWWTISLGAAAGGGVLTSFVGADVHRYLLTATPFLFALAFARAARTREADIHVVFCLLVSVFVWQPFHVVAATRTAYLTYYMPVYVSDSLQEQRLLETLVLMAPLLVLWGLVLAVLHVSRRRAIAGGA